MTTRLELDIPLSAYKYLHPCEASYNDLLESLVELQKAFVNLFKILSFYLTIYQQAYTFLSTTVFKFLYYIFDYVYNQPVFNSIKAYIQSNFNVLTVKIASLVTFLSSVLYLSLSNSAVAVRFRESKLYRGFKTTIRFICFPPIFFISVDVTPIVKELLQILKAFFNFTVALCWLIFNLYHSLIVYALSSFSPSFKYKYNHSLSYTISLTSLIVIVSIPIWQFVIRKRKVRQQHQDQSDSNPMDNESFTEMSDSHEQQHPHSSSSPSTQRQEHLHQQQSNPNISQNITDEGLRQRNLSSSWRLHRFFMIRLIILVNKNNYKFNCNYGSSLKFENRRSLLRYWKWICSSHWFGENNYYFYKNIC